MTEKVKRPPMGTAGASGKRSAVKQIGSRNNIEAPSKQARGRRLRPEYLSAVARERERISALQTGDRSRLPPDSPRLKVSLARVRWLELPFHTEGGRS